MIPIHQLGTEHMYLSLYSVIKTLWLSGVFNLLLANGMKLIYYILEGYFIIITPASRIMYTSLNKLKCMTWLIRTKQYDPINF